MTDTPPAQFDWATELSDAQGHVTLSKQEAKEIGARLRSMSAKLKAYEDLGDAADDVQLLRMGYAAARLEIESPHGQQNKDTPHGQVPEARCQACIYRHDGVYGSWAPDCPVHNYDGTLRTTHDQKPAEIEHVAGDVSKNGAELNMSAQQPAPAAVVYSTPEEMFDAILTPQPAPGERCQHCIDRHDGVYGSWAAPCPYHDDDGKPRPTANAAPQQEAQEPCPTCAALARTVMLDQVSFDRKPDCYGIRQITDDEGVEEWADIRTSPDVAREEANDMMATGRGEIYEVVPLWTTPKPSPTAQAAESVQDMQSVNDAVTIELPPLPDPDLRDVGTTPRDIKEFLRGYATEYALTALTARAPADSVLEDAAQVEIDLFNDLNRISGNTLTAYAKEMCRLGYRKTNAARKQGETNEH